MAATLEPQERQAAIINAISNSEHCRLPCLLGITPGTTRIDTALSHLSHLGITTGNYGNNQGWQIHEGAFHFLADSLVQIISLYLDADGVLGIQVSAENYVNPEYLQAVWAPYSPEAVVQEYGPPSRVVVQAVEGVRGTDFASVPYSIWLFYDDLKAAISYQGAAVDGRTYTICPVFREAGNLTGRILIYTLPAVSALGLDEFIGTQLGIAETRWALEDVTNLSIREFTELLASDNASPCIETSINIHPG